MTMDEIIKRLEAGGPIIAPDGDVKIIPAPQLQDARTAVLTYENIMERYCCGINRAKTIIRSVRACCGGGKLPQGKILASELAYWESLPIKKEVRI